MADEGCFKDLGWSPQCSKINAFELWHIIEASSAKTTEIGNGNVEGGLR